MDNVNLSNLVEDSYVEIGRYVNQNRSVPALMDGLKPSYRWVIYSAYMMSNSMQKTASIIGDCIKSYHFHGDMSLRDVVTSLVRQGIFEGQGNFGTNGLLSSGAPAAAPRYTECKLSLPYRELIDNLLPYVPHFVNEGGHKVPNYLPFPLPLALIWGTFGISIGGSVKIPSFTPRSLIRAYLKDDPYLLENTYGCDIFDKSDIINVWEIGKGKLGIKLNTYEENGSIYMKGYFPFAKPRLKTLLEWRSWTKLIIKDLSTVEPLIEFTKVPRVQYPNYEDIFNEVDKASKSSITYWVKAVNTDGCVYNIGVRDWIDITFSNYVNLLESKRRESIEACKYQIKLYTYFEEIANLILSKRDWTYDKIASKLNIEEQIVEDIGKKSINTLRTLNPNKKIKEYEYGIDEWEKLDCKKYTTNLIKKLPYQQVIEI